MKKRRITLAALLLVCSLTLSGCFFQSADDLYSLPKQTEGYDELQNSINAIISSIGAAYCSPVSGSNQQAVQLTDLDGDGEDEALAFLKTDGDKPLKIYIFKLKDDTYENVDIIEGAGNAFESVEYLQLDGQPGLEIVVGRQISNQVLQSLSVYVLREERAVELMSTTYSEYTTADLNADGLAEVFLLRFDPEERTGVAEMYCVRDDILEREPAALMSSGVESIKRIITGTLEGGEPAVYVGEVYDADNIITDVFALRDGRLVNITAQTDSGMSAQTVRNYFVYATDIDGDGVIELPAPEPLPVYGSGESGEQWAIRWYSMTLSGRAVEKLITYHNYSAGWYLALPEAWTRDLTVYRGEEVSGTRGYVFASWDGSEESQPKVLFTIYAFSGTDRDALAQADGRVALGQKGDVTYAAALGSEAERAGITAETLQAQFAFIHVDWNTGEM